jgi:DNA-binding transcriptional LysR family regulator
LKQNVIIPGAAFGQLRIFVAVAEARSFTRGAQALGMSPSAVSQAVAKLEGELGVALLVRTTRSVTTTDAGTRLLAEAGPALRAASTALASAKSTVAEPSGVLRLNVPRIACRMVLLPLLREFTKRHPNVRTEVVVDDHAIDIVKAGFDAGIRSEERIDKDMIQVRLTPKIRFAVIGSKRYFAQHGRPKHPRDLHRHACLNWRALDGGPEYRWEFSRRGRDLEIAVEGPIVSNDTELLAACAELDLGLAFVTEFEARSALAGGGLETVLGDYASEIAGLFLYFPRHARTLPRLRAFVACARYRHS